MFLSRQTHVLSRQICLLSRQTRQKHVCRDKTIVVTKIVLVAQRARCKVDLGVCSAYCHKAACPGCFRKTNREKEEENNEMQKRAKAGRKTEEQEGGGVSRFGPAVRR